MSLSSSLVSFLVQPLAWVGALLALAIWWLPRRPVVARRALAAGLAGGLLVGWMPLPDALLRRLENTSEPPQGTLKSYAGIVVLGGALVPFSQWRPGVQHALNDAAERVTVPVALMREYPHLRLLYVGREETGAEPGALVEASAAKIILNRWGVDQARVVYEPVSRNTYENAMLSAAATGENKSQPWLLVTSAWHMPRAAGAFRAAGWNVTPYPVDYLTGSHTPWTAYSLAKGALHWQTALHEYAGLLAYRLAGRL